MQYNSSEDRAIVLWYRYAVNMRNCPHVLHNHSLINQILGLLFGCGSTWQHTVATLRPSTKLTPFSRLISAFFCPLLARPLCSRAAFKSATRSEWSGFPSNVTSSSSAILLRSSARTSGVVHERAARHRSWISGRHISWCIFRYR